VDACDILAWHRRLVARKWDYTSRRRPRRPATAAGIRQLVIRIASETPPGDTDASRANWSGFSWSQSTVTVKSSSWAHRHATV
jgi:hypothetical protein